MKKYKRLRYEDRRIIERELRAGKGIAQIAEKLGVHRDTIYKEINRSGATKQSYTAEQAQKAL